MPANFRDLNAAITRMATLSPGGRITLEVVDREIARLRASWSPTANLSDHDACEEVLGKHKAAQLDQFDLL